MGRNSDPAKGNGDTERSKSGMGAKGLKLYPFGEVGTDSGPKELKNMETWANGLSTISDKEGRKSLRGTPGE